DRNGRHVYRHEGARGSRTERLPRSGTVHESGRDGGLRIPGTTGRTTTTLIETSRAHTSEWSSRHQTQWKNIMKIVSALILALVLAFNSQTTFAQSEMFPGVVVKVDQPAKKITINHGPIPQLDMDEPMTMVYAASDPT